MAAWVERRGVTLAVWGCSAGFQRPHQSPGLPNLLLVSPLRRPLFACVVACASSWIRYCSVLVGSRLVLIENQHYLLTLCYARRTACESSPIRDRPTCLAGPRPWAGQAARRVRNVATLQWEPSAMGHPGINVHARALAMECSNRGQVIWLAMMGKRAQMQPHEPGE